MHIKDLVCSKDGSLSLTKLAAASFHFLLFITVGFLTWKKQSFDTEMWLLYAAFTVGHASYDKTMAVIAANRNRHIDIKAGEASQS